MTRAKRKGLYSRAVNMQLKQQIVTLLKQAGKNGMRRIEIIETLHISFAELTNILNKNIILPIGWDSKIDDRIYWVGL